MFKKQKGIKDYTDLITEFNKTKQSPKLDVVIVDEVQDLKASEWDMVHTMINQAKIVYLAGDDDQAIYGKDICRAPAGALQISLVPELCRYLD